MSLGISPFYKYFIVKKKDNVFEGNEDVCSIEHVKHLLQTCKKIVVLTGAGVRTICGDIIFKGILFIT